MKICNQIIIVICSAQKQSGGLFHLIFASFSYTGVCSSVSSSNIFYVYKLYSKVCKRNAPLSVALLDILSRGVSKADAKSLLVAVERDNIRTI